MPKHSAAGSLCGLLTLERESKIGGPGVVAGYVVDGVWNAGTSLKGDMFHSCLHYNLPAGVCPQASSPLIGLVRSAGPNGRSSSVPHVCLSSKHATGRANFAVTTADENADSCCHW